MMSTSIVMKFRAACIAAKRSGAKPTPAADDFYEAIAAMPISTLADRETAFQVFHAVIVQVEMLAPEHAYTPMMIAAEALAACLLRSTDYAAVARRWARRDHASARTTAVRAYSKAADYDPSLVDFGLLSDMAAQLDRTSPLRNVDEVTLRFIGRVAGKLHASPDGIRLIEQLAGQGCESRINAAHSIAFDIAYAPPISHLSIFAEFGPPRLQSERPPRRLFWLFVSLLHDADPTVAEAARVAGATVISRSWPDLWKKLTYLIGRGTVVPGRASSLAADFSAVHDAESAVELALTDLQSRTGRAWTRIEVAGLTPAQLSRADAAAVQPKGIDFALRFPRASNDRAGVLIWDPDLLRQDTEAEAAGLEPLRIKGTPRLFLSYRWSDLIDELSLIDFLAGRLFSRGYDLVFDRDPRNLDKGLSAGDMLLLLHGCTHFVPILNPDVLALLSLSLEGLKCPLQVEWELARELTKANKQLRWVGVWLSSSDGEMPEQLPHPLTAESAVDMRDLRRLFDGLDRVFPTRSFQVTSVYEDGSRQTSAHLKRQQLREAMERARAAPRCATIEAQDVTSPGLVDVVGG